MARTTGLSSCEFLVLRSPAPIAQPSAASKAIGFLVDSDFSVPVRTRRDCLASRTTIACREFIMAYAKFDCKSSKPAWSGYPQELFVMHGNSPIFTLSTVARTFLACVLLTCGELVPGPVRAQSPAPACAVADQNARTLVAARVITPPIAVAEKIYGEVVVVITLDAQSHIESASISRSPSVILNQAALQAARASTFQTTIKNCQPVGGSFRFIVVFQDPNPKPPASIMYFSGAWSCRARDGRMAVRTYSMNGGALESKIVSANTDSAAVVDFAEVNGRVGLTGFDSKGLRYSASLDVSTSDRLIFTGAIFAPDPGGDPVIVRFSFEKTDQDHYVQTVERAADAAGTMRVDSVENCARTQPAAPR